MATFQYNTINSAPDSNNTMSGVDFAGKSLKMDTEEDAKPIEDAICNCPNLQYLTLTGNTLGIAAAEAIAQALKGHPELKIAKWSDIFTGKMKTEIPPTLTALGDGMIEAGAKLSLLDLSDNAFGPIGVEGLAKLLQSDVCKHLQELKLNNNGLGIAGARILAKALSSRPPRLRVFVAGRNRLENQGATALAEVFKKMGTLEEVALPQNSIYHVGITALSEAFKHNPRLSSLNLKDNIMGVRGAAAIAAALPKLRNLKALNFSDCLLRSKGGKTLAKAFKDSSFLLEYLDLSHNELGHDACTEIVEAIIAPAGGPDKLISVMLGGNYLGTALDKKTMYDKLGHAANLSDGEDSDDDYLTDSSEDESDKDTDSSENTEDSATEDARDRATVARLAQNATLRNSGTEVVKKNISAFLRNPTEENLKKLGPDAVKFIDAHLQLIHEPADKILAYVEATLSVSGLLSEDPTHREQATQMYAVLLKRADELPAATWLLANTLLVGLGLIKSEDLEYKLRWHLPRCFDVLAQVITGAQFPNTLKNTLRFFIKNKLPVLPENVATAIEKHASLQE